MKNAIKEISIDNNYKEFIYNIKTHIQNSQIEAALSVNRELILLYWDMAEKIIEMQKKSKWGDGFLQQMSNDLSKEFPNIKGFSYRNLRYIKQWYLFWQQLVAKISIAKQFIPKLNSRQLVEKLDISLDLNHRQDKTYFNFL
jgi:hypothetical protein